MEHSSPVSKIVATATSSSWAQAYSAGKLHLVLSLSGESEKSIALLGKDTLERLQREFFALDEKNLSDLKKVVEVVVGEIDSTIDLSLVLTTIVEEVLYIVIHNAGSVLLKREEHIIPIGTGEIGQTVGFSGNLNPGDVVLVATEGFLKTVSFENIEKSLQSASPHEISENLAPFLHGSDSGTEAGLVWNMIGSRKPIATEEEDLDHPNDTLDLDEMPKDHKKKSLNLSILQNIPRTINLSVLKSVSRKQLILVLAIILVVILGTSIWFEKNNRENKKQNTEVQAIIDSNKQKYEDAIALMSLNKSLAIEELEGIKQDVESKKNKFPQGSPASKTLEAFLSQVESALGGEVTNSASQINVFFDADKNSEISTVSFITVKGGEVVVIGSKKGGLIKSDGSVDSTFNGAEGVRGITADEKNVYILAGETVRQIAKSDGSTSTLIQKQANPLSIDTFGGNIYLLSGTDKTVYKYLPTSFNKASYFTTDTTLTNPSSLTIDASIYVITNGEIRKFTRGAADNFSYKGSTLSAGSQMYTDVDYTNLYVLDPVKKFVYILDKSGNQVSQVSLKGMKNTTSIAADETNKKIYITADNKIYSVSF